MKYLKYTIMSLVLILVSCLGNKKNSNTNVENEEIITNSVPTKDKIDIDEIRTKLCDEFPKELILKYNPDATHIEIESVENGSGGILHCDIKLFYGKKEYEYWKGQVAANINQQKDPFWQYNPERNATLFHKVEELGDKAVYISNMYQLQILKDGVLYMITPPNNGNKTNSGKDTKEITLEIAKHYNL